MFKYSGGDRELRGREQHAGRGPHRPGGDQLPGSPAHRRHRRQLRLHRGQPLRQGGRGVYYLLSTAQGGRASRVVPQIPHGPYQVVAVPNYIGDYLVTEHGVVNLEGKSLRQRAEAIISIAHPDFRAELRRAARTLGLV
ncbi:MAG: hypothetical protein C4290_12250 [Chloroflexota bacterium]